MNISVVAVSGYGTTHSDYRWRCDWPDNRASIHEERVSETSAGMSSPAGSGDLCFSKGGQLSYRYAAPFAERDIPFQGLNMQSWREENNHHGRSRKLVTLRLKCGLNKIAISINPKKPQLLQISENLNLSTDGDVLHLGQYSDRAIAVETSQSTISGDEYIVAT
ncbi:hypothetical protein [Serratia proteamaculans]